MKRLVLLFASIFLCMPVVCAKQTQSTQNLRSGSSLDQSADHKQIEEVLDQYVTAYERQSLPRLVEIWPDLPKQTKEYKKIEQHFNESIFFGSVKASIEPQDWQIDKDQAQVRCVRNEQYVKYFTTSEVIGGDLRGPKAFGQLPEPSKRTFQRKVRKNRIVMVTLHRNGDSWTIASVAEEGSR